MASQVIHTNNAISTIITSPACLPPFDSTLQTTDISDAIKEAHISQLADYISELDPEDEPCLQHVPACEIVDDEYEVMIVLMENSATSPKSRRRRKGVPVNTTHSTAAGTTGMYVCMCQC